MDRFKEHSLCNFEYILATIHSSTINSLIRRLQLTVSKVLDIELALILKCITLAEDILQFDPLQLASEVIGRLRQVKGTVFGYFISKKLCVTAVCIIARVLVS